jgi:hypothetical protein
LKPLTHRSRDNFPNPIADDDNPYVPLNSPAIGDLFDLFDFGHHDGDHARRRPLRTFLTPNTRKERVQAALFSFLPRFPRKFEI